MSTESAQQHIRVVALATLALGALGILGPIVMLLMGGAMMAASGLSFSMEGLFAGGIVGFIGLFALIFSLPLLIAGFGLLARKPWARVLTIIIAIFSLFGFPIGTLLGAYQLWVLAFNDETRRAYDLGPVSTSARRDYAA